MLVSLVRFQPSAPFRLYFFRLPVTLRLYFQDNFATFIALPMTTRFEMPAVPVRRRRQAPWVQRVMVVLILVALADSLFGDRGISARGRVRREYQQTQQELAAIREVNAGLREQIRRLQSDPDAIETVAREDLGVIRPGELLVLIAR